MTGKIYWKKSYWLLAFAIISIAGIFINILYGHRYEMKKFFGLVFLMTLSFPIYIQMEYFKFDSSKWYEKLINIFIGVIWIVPYVCGIIWCKDMYNKNQLEKYPETAFGKITEYEINHGRRTRHYAVFQYKINGQLFKQRVKNDNSFYKIDDRLKLLVSKKDPEIFRIIAFKKE